MKEELREAILSGRLAPGERLVEERLATDHGVSRNPVREAIRSLASERLVEVTARRGAVVTSLSPEEAQEILEVRATLEGANAKLAARRRDSIMLRRLNSVFQDGSTAIESGNLEKLPRLNDEFHECLVLAGHNRVMSDLVKALRDRSALLFRGIGSDLVRETWLEHAGILRAVLDGDTELASLLAYRHVINAGRQAPFWTSTALPR